MTIQDLGSIGELVAAVATIATLIYLARQLRANTDAVRGEARRAHRESSTAANLVIASDPQVASLFNAGLIDFKALPPEQRTQFTFLLADMMGNWQTAYAEFDAGVLDKQMLDDVGVGYHRIISSPGVRDWWAAYRKSYPTAFREYVDSRIQQSP